MGKAKKSERLDKYLSEALGLSRSQSRELIARKKVLVDGIAAQRADQPLTGGEVVTLEGRRLEREKYIYLMLNKPQGVVSASRDKRDVTVTDLVQKEFPRRQLFPAGRLDKTSTGFVLITDDGVFAHQILAPRRHVSKTYQVLLDCPCTPEMCRGFEEGVTLADGQKLAPALLRPDPRDPCRAEVVLRQGVYHQIKRMFGVYGAGVNALHRLAIGSVQLDETLAPGQWRPLSGEELETLRRESGG